MGAFFEAAWARCHRRAVSTRGIDAAICYRFVEMLVCALALAKAFRQDVLEGLFVAPDGLRDLACAAQIVRDHAVYYFGPNIHALQFGHLGPLYYYFLALPLALRSTATALSLWFFAWHALEVVLVLALGRQLVGRRAAWVALLILCAASRRGLLQHSLEHETFVLPFVLLSTLALLAHERRGHPLALVGALLLAGVAAQFQSLAVCQLFLVAASRRRSRRAVGAPLALACAVAFALPFALALIPDLLGAPPPGPLLRLDDGFDEALIHQSLVPIVLVAAAAAAYGGRAARSYPACLWLAGLAAASCVPLLVGWTTRDPAADFALRFFSFAAHVQGGPPELTSGRSAEWAELLSPQLVLGLAVALGAALRSRLGLARIYGRLGAAPLFVVAPTLAVFAAHPSFLYLSSALVWLAYAVAYGVDQLLAPRRGSILRAAGLAAVAGPALAAALLLPAVAEWVHYSSGPTTRAVDGIMTVDRDLRRFARAHDFALADLRGRVHGVDASGRTFCPWGGVCQTLLELNDLGPGARPPDPSAPHLRWTRLPGAATGDPLPERFSGEVESYVPALRYDSAIVLAGTGVNPQLLQLPYERTVCPSIGRWPEPGSFVDRGTCHSPTGPLDVTVERDPTEASRRGLGDAINVLALNISQGLPRGETAEPCAIEAWQDDRRATPRLLATRLNPGRGAWDRRWMVWRVDLAPYTRRSRLRVILRCDALARLDVWDAP